MILPILPWLPVSFSYACLSGYEVLAQNDSSVKSLQGILNGYPEIKKPDSLKGYHVQLSALLADDGNREEDAAFRVR